MIAANNSAEQDVFDSLAYHVKGWDDLTEKQMDAWKLHVLNAIEESGGYEIPSWKTNGREPVLVAL